MTLSKVNIKEKFSQFSDHWNPRIIGALNDHQVKIAKIQGPFVWHAHEDEDELFFVVRGTLKMEFRDRVIELNPGEMLVVPKGVEHRPYAEEEVEIIMIEPASTVNTGTNPGVYTRENLESI